jgi:Flp pilus assembly protein TadD
VATPRERIAEARARAATAPAEPYWPYHAAELYRSLGEPDSALDAVRGALARNAGYAPALALFSRLEYDAGRHDDAIAVLESARLAAHRADAELGAELLAGLALHLAAAGRGAEAVEALNAAPRSRATDATAAVIAFGQSRGAAAAKLAEEALEHHPASAACQNNAGIARLSVGDVAGARKALLEAIELDPTRPGPYYNLTILEKYYALDDDAAARWLAKYRTLSSDDPDGLGATLAVPDTKDLAEGSKP